MSALAALARVMPMLRRRDEIYIIFYYLLIPFSWALMLDVYLGKPFITMAVIFIWIGIRIGTWGYFCYWCDWAFMRSVVFLSWLNRLGGNYVLNSVVVCVAIPILIYAGLIFLLLHRIY